MNRRSQVVGWKSARPTTYNLRLTTHLTAANGLLSSCGFRGQVAQLVEQWTENPCVAGSIPALPI
jgi:hypothetical protein